MSVSLLPYPKFKSSDYTGNALAGGKVYTYAAGTTTPLATYTDSSGLVANANPVILDSNGEASIWFSSASYKIVLTDANDVTQWSADNLSISPSYNILSASSGSSLVGFIQSGTGAVATNLQARGRLIVYVTDFGAKGDGSTDDTTAIQNAITYVQGLPYGGIVYFPKGLYKVTATLTVTAYNIKLQGESRFTTVLHRTANYGNTITAYNASSVIQEFEICDISLQHDNTTVGMSDSHIYLRGVVQGLFYNLQLTKAAYNIYVLGCANLSFGNVVLNMDWDGIDAKKTSIAGIALVRDASPPSGGVNLPTQIFMDRLIQNGPGLNAGQYGLMVNACEQISVTNSYFGNAFHFNVFLNQLSDNANILSATFANCYFDGAGDESVVLAGSTGNGSTYVGPTHFSGCHFIGNGVGSIGNGLHLDGTNRGGSFPYAVHGLVVDGCTITGNVKHGISLDAGVEISITGCNIVGNNTNNTTTGCGILLGSNVFTCTIVGNNISGGVAGIVPNYQIYGVSISLGASDFVVSNNNVRYNATAGILDNSAGTVQKVIYNNAGFNGNRAPVSPTVPSSTVDFLNPYGSPSWVYITGGTVTHIKLNGTDVSTTTPVSFMVGPNDKVNLTYTVAPAWTWFPQ